MQVSNFNNAERFVGSSLIGVAPILLSDASGWFSNNAGNTNALFTKGATYPGGATPSVTTFQDYNDLQAPFETFVVPPNTTYTCRMRLVIHASNYTAGTNFVGKFDIKQITGQSTPGTNPPTWIALNLGATAATLNFTAAPNTSQVLDSVPFALTNNTTGFLEFAPLLTLTSLSTGNTGLLSVNLKTYGS